jgi:hypothetical protein
MKVSAAAISLTLVLVVSAFGESGDQGGPPSSRGSREQSAATFTRPDPAELKRCAAKHHLNAVAKSACKGHQ